MKRLMKILHITQFLGVGGLEKVLNLLIKEQQANQHQVELLVYDHMQAWVEVFKNEGITVHHDYMKKDGYDLNLLKYMAKMIEGVDVVHTHDVNPLLYIAPLRFASVFKNKSFPRFIHTAHGMDHLHRRPIVKVYEKAGSLLTDYMIGVSEAVCEVYAKDLLIPKDKIVQIDNGIRVASSFPQRDIQAREKINSEFGLNPSLPTWVAVARVVPLKDQELLIEAARRRPGINLLIVGPSGDENYWQKLAGNLPNNVRMTGPRSDIENILAGSDYFISASHHEGIPISVLEAGAQGLPCLLSAIPGHLTLQKQTPNKVAEYFEVKNIESLIKEMQKMEGTPSESLKMGRSLYDCVKQNYSSQSMYEKYLNVYQGV
jgi:L-malate glycosyltransferase